MKNKISSIAKSKVVDYRDQFLTEFWQVKNGRLRSNRNFEEQLIGVLLSATEGVVCIQSGSITDSKIIEQILNTAKGRMVKVYILVNEYSPELAPLHEKCLIRYGLRNTGSFILANPNTNRAEGVFFNHGFSSESFAVENQILLELNKEEVSELFRHFCYHFWGSAQKEVIEKGQHFDIQSKPIDVFHNPDSFGDKDFVYATLFDFVEQSSRGDVSNQLIVPSKKENQRPIKINPISKQDLGEAGLSELPSLRAFENHSPELPDDGISCGVAYTWTNVPFYLPENSSKSALYEQWRDEETKTQNHLNLVLKRIEEAEKKENAISASLKRFFLGKKNTFNKLKTDIEDLKQQDYSSLSESVLKNKISHINEIHAQVENGIGEIEREDKKAKLDEEIYDLQERKKAKNDQLEKSREELGNMEFKAAKSMEAFLEKHGIQESDLGKTRSHWGQQSGNKNKKKNPRQADEAEANLEELKEIEDKVFIEKRKSEVNNLEKEVKRIEDDIKRKNQAKVKLQPQAEAGSALTDYLDGRPSAEKSNSGKSFSIKELPQLPQVGELFLLGDQSYLAIKYWEQYEEAKGEAQRLKAKLCTIKN